MDKTKTERVKGVGFRDLWAISTLDEFRAVASKIEALVPIEFHATIKFDVSVDDDFGSFTVTYERPETDFERIDRERHITQIIERDKARDFAEYQRLKEKFDINPSKEPSVERSPRYKDGCLIKERPEG